MRTILFVVLALLVAAGAVMLHAMPVRHYAVTCTRAAELTCVLEQARASGARPATITLGWPARAEVRVVSRRRGGPRVLLYLRSPAGEHFAAEFEGGDATDDAARAASRLNAVLTRPAPATARIDAEAPPIYRRLAWAMLGVMALITVAGYRAAGRRDALLWRPPTLRS